MADGVALEIGYKMPVTAACWFGNESHVLDALREELRSFAEKNQCVVIAEPEYRYVSRVPTDFPAFTYKRVGFLTYERVPTGATNRVLEHEGIHPDAIEVIVTGTVRVARRQSVPRLRACWK